MNKKGFTLIEVLVVIAIIGILSGIIIVSVNGAINSANDARRRTDIDTIRRAVIYYKIQSVDGLYPVEEDVCTIGGGTTPCTVITSIIPNFPVDPVSGYYTYASDGTDFTISSTLSDSTIYSYNSTTGFASETGGGSEILINGGFELGNVGWTTYSDAGIYSDSEYARSGSYFAYVYTDGTATTYIEQTIDFTNVNTLTFWELAPFGFRSILIGGTEAWSSSYEVLEYSRIDIDTSSFDGLQTLRFSSDSDAETAWYIDDVSVSDQQVW
ncbi:MAG TPA: prepilin-type N-terminal cleavage/methylation domain-containing protein [Candidatus Pacearchaeota archaeon]|nr:prepilin-type N-terminal cleavage/methylation domain-containing protein [Candidatus Pacearchaeota archaeon]HPR79645.1 prepilin-type N-terminal cleavage/methylation domain-containing protein [Candidatus Pacearchaeota archaeon]